MRENNKQKTKTGKHNRMLDSLCKLRIGLIKSQITELGNYITSIQEPENIIHNLRIAVGKVVLNSCDIKTISEETFKLAVPSCKKLSYPIFAGTGVMSPGELEE